MQTVALTEALERLALLFSEVSKKTRIKYVNKRWVFLLVCSWQFYSYGVWIIVQITTTPPSEKETDMVLLIRITEDFYHITLLSIALKENKADWHKVSI